MQEFDLRIACNPSSYQSLVEIIKVVKRRWKLQKNNEALSALFFMCGVSSSEAGELGIITSLNGTG